MGAWYTYLDDDEAEMYLGNFSGAKEYDHSQSKSPLACQIQ